jgi:hypothetical protein
LNFEPPIQETNAYYIFRPGNWHEHILDDTADEWWSVWSFWQTLYKWLLSHVTPPKWWLADMGCCVHILVHMPIWIFPTHWVPYHQSAYLETSRSLNDNHYDSENILTTHNHIKSKHRTSNLFTFRIPKTAGRSGKENCENIEPRPESDCSLSLTHYSVGSSYQFFSNRYSLQVFTSDTIWLIQWKGERGYCS